VNFKFRNEHLQQELKDRHNRWVNLFWGAHPRSYPVMCTFSSLHCFRLSLLLAAEAVGANKASRKKQREDVEELYLFLKEQVYRLEWNRCPQPIPHATLRHWLTTWTCGRWLLVRTWGAPRARSRDGHRRSVPGPAVVHLWTYCWTSTC